MYTHSMHTRAHMLYLYIYHVHTRACAVTWYIYIYISCARKYIYVYALCKPKLHTHENTYILSKQHTHRHADTHKMKIGTKDSRIQRDASCLQDQGAVSCIQNDTCFVYRTQAD